MLRRSTTDMVTLVEIQKELHAERLHRWRQQPAVARFMFSQKPISWADHLRWLDALARDSSRKHWVIAFNGLPIGSAYLTEIDTEHSRAMSGLYVAQEDFRGRGVGAAAEYLMLVYAFQSLGLEKVSCEITTGNDASLRMHTRMGFVQEGLFRRHVRLGGEWSDVQRLALLREKWLQTRSMLQNELEPLIADKPADTDRIQTQ